jgi:cytochrome b6-f complex iron-sulfur subunit
MKLNDIERPTSDALPSDKSRREFFRQTCQTATLGALAVLLQACGASNPAGPSSSASTLPILNGTTGQGVVTLSIDASSPLATVGGVAFVQAGGTSLLVGRTSQDGFTALSAICTHQGCQISGYSGSAYVCPCHGSRFSPSGQVLNGPASTALRSYSTQFASPVLTITL